MDECVHGLAGCATCEGTDTLVTTRASNPGSQMNYTPWSEDERRIARDPSLTTTEVAAQLGRLPKNVSAYRTGPLGMTGYAGWTPSRFKNGQ